MTNKSSNSVLFWLVLSSLVLTVNGCTGNNGKTPIIEEGGDGSTDKKKKGKGSKGKKPGAPGSPSRGGVASPPTNPNASTVKYKPLTGEYNMAQVNQWVQAHRAAKGGAAANFRYTYMPLDMVSAANQDKRKLNQARVGLMKTLNYVSANPLIYVGEDASDGHGLVWAFNVEQVWQGQGVRKWNVVAGGRGKNGIISTRQNERSFAANQPVAFDRLVYNLISPNIYNVLIDTPGREGILRRRIGAKNDKLWWAGQNEAIVFGPRVSWALETQDGRIYWATGDEFDGNENKKRLVYLREGRSARPGFRSRGEHMLRVEGNASRSVASEGWLQKTACREANSNCLLNWYIWGNAAQERGRAEFTFVLDPGNPINPITQQGVRGGRLLTGRSCIAGCHPNGANAKLSDMDLLASDPNSGLSAEKISQIRQYWATNAELSQLFARVNNGFKKSMRVIVTSVSDSDATHNEEMINGEGEGMINMLLLRCDVENKCGGSRGGIQNRLGGGGGGGRGGLFGNLFGRGG